ncbi:MAG: Fic family protein, partial [Bacteroidia bacterium]
ITAMKITMAQLQDLPFSSRLIRNGHAKILNGVRGSDKQPGEFRRSQNWIGGATLKDAVFVPPPHTEITRLMSDLEHFANNDKYPIPELLKVAILHFQFETIHPFLDGNGRVGRMLIPLYLMSKGVLKQPVLYLSGFFEKHRSLYYDNLTRVRTHNDLAQWLKFFLAGIIETAKHGVKTYDSILRLQKEVDTKLIPLGSRAIHAQKVMGHLFRSPIVDAQQVAAIINKSNVSAYKLIADLERLGILEEMTGGQRGRMYRFREYLDLFN